MITSTALDIMPYITSLVLIVFSLALYFVIYLKTKYTYWERRGVPYVKPVHLFFGNAKDLMLKRVPSAEGFERFYKELDGHRFGGFYMMSKPAVMIRDPELVKSLLVKNFSNFHDRIFETIDEDLDPLSSDLVNLCGERWKYARYKLVPTFSSGKLRQMEFLIKGCIEELDDYLTKTTSQAIKTTDIRNVKELMAKYTTDVIGTCAFGLKCNTIRDEDSEFRRIGRLIFTPSYRSAIRVIFRFFNPRLNNLFKIKAEYREVEDFFKSVLEQAVKQRESSAQKRNDFLQLMLDIQAEEKAQLQSNGHQQNGHQQNNTHVKKKEKDEKSGKTPSGILFTKNVVASNVLAFFKAGFLNTAYTLSYCLYELALNPEICEKLKDEVESVKRAHDGNLGYNAMKELNYMDAVLSETLRKYPIIHITGRVCTEPFQMPGSAVVIEKGTSIIIPIHGLHHDPKYFPEPEKFLPQRFSEENKGSIIPGTYLPFGDGPRICIGMRFAWFVMTSILSYLVCNYTFHPSEKTGIPLKYNRHGALHIPADDIWVQFKKR